MDRPLVTFVVLSYNQERFIREALRGALAQTYSPLQIIVSDDCSQDETFEIIQQELAGYDGPHQILLNRNDRNLGLAGHYNRVMELARGDLIVSAAGDDVSLPTRTEELVRLWSDEGAFSVYSNSITMKEDGGSMEDTDELAISAPLGDWRGLVESGRRPVAGCTHAWDRTVFDTFGPLPESDIHEDWVIPFRSALLGKIAHTDKYLVKWRRHGATLSHRYDDLVRVDLARFAKLQAVTARRHASDGECWLRDIRLFLQNHPEMETELSWGASIIAARVEFYKFKVAALEGNRMERLRGCSRAIRRVRKLGMKYVTKVGLLGVSPMTYCRMQRRWYEGLAS
jgi:glycosyltransferase involved in cell wall biosynthesis